MKKKRKRQTVNPGKEPEPIQTQHLARVRVGDNVYRQPISFLDGKDKNARMTRGTVVWVHPTGRFHVVEFEKGVRESFAGVYGEDRGRKVCMMGATKSEPVWKGEKTEGRL